MLKIAKLAIKETIMERLVDKETGEEIEVAWDSKLSDDLGLDSLDMVELVMFLEECFAVELTDDMAMKLSQLVMQSKQLRKQNQIKVSQRELILVNMTGIRMSFLILIVLSCLRNHLNS